MHQSVCLATIPVDDVGMHVTMLNINYVLVWRNQNFLTAIIACAMFLTAILVNNSHWHDRQLFTTLDSAFAVLATKRSNQVARELSRKCRLLVGVYTAMLTLCPYVSTTMNIVHHRDFYAQFGWSLVAILVLNSWASYLINASLAFYTIRMYFHCQLDR